jgi:adenylate kinase family enzyme
MSSELPVGRRIIIVGSSCAGKSTLGERLAGLLGVPFVELDALFWKPGWVNSDDDEFMARIAEETAGDGWVVAGNYHRQTTPLTWPRADTIIWLDMSRPVTTWRVLKRSWRRWRSNELLWGTNREKFWEQLKVWSPTESLIAYNWSTHHEKRARYLAAMRDPAYAHVRFHHLRTPREVSGLLAALSTGAEYLRPTLATTHSEE